MFSTLIRRSGGVALAAVAVVTVLAACAPTRPEIRSQQDPGANLSVYRTYGYVSPLGTDKAGYATVLTSHLKNAVGRELEARGYHYSATAPDLLVNFYANIEEKTEVYSTPTGPMYGGYYGYRGGMYGGWGGYDVQTVNYKQGTLSIDLVDGAKKQLVWTGIAEGRVSKEARQNPGPAIDRVVAEIFATYPGRAATQ